MMADTPTNTSTHVPPAASSGVSGGVGGNDPNVIPQWKKELIQRRKNLAKTIGAVATQVHDSASTVAAAISASSSPVTPHPRTPTGGGAFPVGSPFYAGVGTKEGGTTHSSASSTDTTNCGPLDTVPDSERQQLAENEENVVRSSSSSPSAAGAEAEGTDKTDSLHPVGKAGDGGGGDGGGVKQEGEPRMVAIARDNNRCPSIPSQAATSPTTAGVHFGAHFGGANEPAQQQQQQQRSSVGGSVRAAEAVLVPATSSAAASGSLSAGAANGPQSHSNAGSEHSGSSSSSCSSGSSTVAAAIAPATRPNSSSSVVPVSADREIVPSVSNGSVAKGSSLGSSSVGQQQPQQQQQQQQQREGGAARKMVAATAAEEIVVVYEKSSVLDGTVVDVSGGGGGVGVGGGGGAGAGGPGFGDAGEELKYGPGIVSRLRCRYLSLALRQSVTKQRPSLNSMRRATSLNNLLDEESEDLSEREQSIGSEGGGHQNQHHHHHQQQQQQQHQQQHHHHLHHQHQQQQQQQAQQKKYHSQNYHYQQQQQQREHYANGNGNNHNHNHNHLHQQQPPLHATVVLQPPYQKQQPQFAPKQPWMIHQHQQEEQQQQQQVVKTAAPFLRGVQNSYTRASRQVEKKNEYNRYTKHHRGGGGADAVLLKRARSVEALVRYDHHKAWERDATGPPLAAAAAAAAAPTGVATAPQAAAAAELVSSAELGSDVIILDEINVQAATTTTATATSNGVVASTTPSSTTTATVLESNGISSSGPGSGATPLPPPTAMMNGATRGGGGTDLPLLVSDCVTIEEKIINGREKGDPKPKRLTSFIDADERPPPDVVKQTMKIFEANANRRGGRANGTTGGPPGSEVASKVASYRSIIISGSATATAGATTAAAAVSAEKPPITHPKPPLSPKKPNIKPRTASPKHQAPAPTAPVGKPPPTPKSLEAVNNLKNSSIISSNNSSGIGSVTGPRNGNHGKQQAAPAAAAVAAAVAESVPLLGTPPSPPARSKHAPSSPLVCSSNGAASVGAVVGKSMQSEMMGVAAHGVVVESAAEAAANAVEAENNALKNGGGGCVRDHHNNYENGLTQTAAATVATASKTAGSDSSGHQHIQHNATAQGASSSSSSSSSPPPQGGICESPSIQQLTSKLASLHLATSTPTGAGANGTTSPVNAASSAAQDRRNLEYVTSDEEEEDDEDDEDDEQDGVRHHTTGSYTVNPDSGSEQEQEEHDRQHRSKDARDGGVAGGSGNDADDDEDDGEGEQPANSDDDDDDGRSVRKISRTAMENIARAGTTTQFRFNGAVKSSYLPGAAAAAAAAVVTAAPSTKPPAPPIPKSRESLGAKTANGAAAGNNEANGSAGRSPSEVAAGSLAGNSAVNNGGAGALGGAGARNEGAGGGSPLTRREIEKNQINREKSGEAAAAPAPAGPNSLLHAGSGGAFHHVQGGQGGGASASVGGAGVTAGQKLASGSNSSNSNGSSNSVSDSTTSFVAKWGTGGAGGQSGAATATAASPLAGLVARKKTKPPPSQQDGTNTMVFNFSDRKDVPDYIENDGVIIRPRPRELPKPGESGFVVLGDLTLETSTDPDDAWAMGPPSPCNGEFANAYIVINGKSSMRNKTSRSNKFKIQFDDSLTSTYEYPSETSLLEPNGLDDADSGPDGSAGLVPPAFATDNGLLSHTNKLLSSVPLGSAPFASYTPVKAAIDTTFELGVTRTPSPSAASTTSSTGSNGSHSSSSSNSHQSATSHSTNDLQHPHQQQQQQQQPQQHSIGNGHRHQLVDRPNNNGVHTSNGHSNGADVLLLNGTADPGTDGMNGTGEPESIQYLKPASDEQTVNWSQGTRVTDLLF